MHYEAFSINLARKISYHLLKDLISQLVSIIWISPWHRAHGTGKGGHSIWGPRSLEMEQECVPSSNVFLWVWGWGFFGWCVHRPFRYIYSIACETSVAACAVLGMFGGVNNLEETYNPKVVSFYIILIFHLTMKKWHWVDHMCLLNYFYKFEIAQN